MPRYEYKVLPAPKKPGKIKGVKGTENKFAAELASLMNAQGTDGWEYQRTDTLPCETRQGLTGRVTTFQNMLIFRRKIVDPNQVEVPKPKAEPVPAMPAFRSASPEAAPALNAAAKPPQGDAPTVGPASSRPDIAAQ